MMNMGELFRYPRLLDVPMARVELHSAEPHRTLLQRGDLMFARRSLTLEGAGKCAIVHELSEPTTWEGSIIRARVQPSIASPEYLFYYFGSPAGRRQMETIVEQVAAAGIRSSDLARLKLLIPPVHEQRAIAEVLGALDDKIAANTKLASTLDGFIRAKFEWVRQTSNRRPFFEVVDVDFGEAFAGQHFADEGEGRPLIRIRDLKTFTPQTWTTEVRAREVLVQPGDVLIGMDAEFRPTPWLGEVGLLNQRVCRARSGYFGRAYLREALIRPMTAVENEKSATTVIHLNKADLVRSTVELPDDASLSAFEDQAEPAYTQRIDLSRQNRTLAEIRNTLLPQLMSGKLRVRDAQKIIEEAV